MSAIIVILLYDAIPSCELDELSNELEWLDTNANECKWGPTMKGPKNSMFGLRKNMYNWVLLHMESK
jgi:hypothetical protein